ncbi:MAG: ornithine carbamoyltransferase [Ignavibacteriales bacterium]|nr:ornithine carbamoyltransferase [Ignavibacteriales bacterium]
MKKDFLSLLDLEAGELEELFLLTDALKTDVTRRPLAGRSVAMIFQKPSLRTRVSFEVGVFQLGGHPIFLSQEGVGIGVREKASDMAELLSRMTAMIVARLFDHSLLTELANRATVPVVNALTDLSHPCQILADAYTMRQHGKWKPGVKVVFVGDGNNVVNSWLELAMLYPLHFVLAAPKGYEPNEEILRQARKQGVSTIEIIEDPNAAVKNADVLYTDVWTSMGQEAESEKRKKDFAGYQVNARLLAQAKPDCAVMHCLPAHRGEEITNDVIEGSQSIVFDEAENRLHVQKAVMAKLLESVD